MTTPGGPSESRRNIRRQAQFHPVHEAESFQSPSHLVNHLMHLRAYEEALPEVAGKRVLDWGCNAGYGMELLRREARSVAGLDVSPRAVELACRRLGEAADVRLFDGERAPFPDGAFDAVCSFQVIEHLTEVDAYLGEVVRLLAPGGIFLVTTPNAALRLDPGMTPWNELHVREWRAAELRSLLARWFAAVELRGMFGTEEISRVERSRVAAARRAARPGALRTVRGMVGRRLPRLKALYGAARRRSGAPAPSALLFTTADFGYRTADLDDSLDLMAICREPRDPRAARESAE